MRDLCFQVKEEMTNANWQYFDEFRHAKHNRG